MCRFLCNLRIGARLRPLLVLVLAETNLLVYVYGTSAQDVSVYNLFLIAVFTLMSTMLLADIIFKDVSKRWTPFVFSVPSLLATMPVIR